MLVWKKILLLRQQERDQRAWIERCGGDLAGYIAHYGDPGIPPMKDGKPQIITIPEKDHHLVRDLARVPGTTNQFYSPMYGAGGTLIYQADKNRLDAIVRELSEYHIRCFGAVQKANEMEGKVNVRQFC